MKEFLEWSTGRLSQAGIGLPRLEAEVLLAGALRLRREEIYLRPDRFLNEDEKSISRELVNRRVRREPIAYILGSKEFWSLDFKITSNVLIPRPETETLIETLLSLNEEIPKGESLQVLDLGTGSGVIAIVAALEITNCQVTAIDLSPEILAVAKTNAARHGVLDKINFVECDIFTGLPEVLFDFIVSNPPYIETKLLGTLVADICNFEPKKALDGGKNGLDFYRRIIPGALDYLKEGGGLVLETGATQANAVSCLLNNENRYEAIKITQDFGKYDRVVSARKKS